MRYLTRFFKWLYKTIVNLVRRLGDDQVSVCAASSSFFLILSIFPIIILILNIIRFTPISESLLIKATTEILPDTLDPLFVTIIDEMYSMTSTTIISITAVATVWSAGKGILAMMQGFNSIYHTKEKRNYFLVRLIASFYTVIIIVLLVLSLGMFVFGNTILDTFDKYAPKISPYFLTLLSQKFFHMPIILTLFIILLYKMIPMRRFFFINLLPGAIFSSLGWILFSEGFSFYIKRFASFSYMYGSLATVIILMLWIYFCIYIIFIGAEINIYCKKNIDIYRLKKQEKKIAKKKLSD